MTVYAVVLCGLWNSIVSSYADAVERQLRNLCYAKVVVHLLWMMVQSARGGIK